MSSHQRIDSQTGQEIVNRTGNKMWLMKRENVVWDVHRPSAGLFDPINLADGINVIELNLNPKIPLLSNLVIFEKVIEETRKHYPSDYQLYIANFPSFNQEVISRFLSGRENCEKTSFEDWVSLSYLLGRPVCQRILQNVSGLMIDARNVTDFSVFFRDVSIMKLSIDRFRLPHHNIVCAITSDFVSGEGIGKDGFEMMIKAAETEWDCQICIADGNHVDEYFGDDSE